MGNLEARQRVASAPRYAITSAGRALSGVHVKRIQRFAGGATGDRCVLEVEQTAVVANTQLLFTPAPVEVRMIEATGGGARDRLLFWGWTSGGSYSLTRDGVAIEARQARFHFGEPLEGMDELLIGVAGESTKERAKSKTPTTATLEEDLVFNPLVDGIVRGNMRGDAADGNGKRALFIDPSAIRTSRARRYQRLRWIEDEAFAEAADELKWTLAEAVHYLCWTLNPDETYIANPPSGETGLKELRSVFGTSRADLRDVRIPLGSYLPEALDALLRPLGLGWYVGYQTDRPALSFYGREASEDRTKRVLLEPPETDLWSTSRNDLTEMQISLGYQSLVNEVTVLGDFEEVEATIELWPAWDADRDEDLRENRDDYAQDADSYKNDPDKQRVGREFVANEAGDYTGIRSGLTEPLDLKPIFGKPQAVRRRRAYPCITLGAGQAPIGLGGYYVEYRIGDRNAQQDLTTDDPSADWKSIAELEGWGSLHVLHNEIGIRFDGQMPPAEVIDDPNQFQLRITCTLRSDRRVRGTAARRDASPQPLVAADVVKEEGAFQRRRIGAGSRFYSADLVSRLILGTPLENDAVDDSTAINAYAERLRSAWDQADCSGMLRVALIDGREYELGDAIAGVEGREISFYAGGEPPRYPLITAIDYDIDGECRHLTIATMRSRE